MVQATDAPRAAGPHQNLAEPCLLQVYSTFQNIFVPKLKLAVERELKNSKRAGMASSRLEQARARSCAES